jgi:choline-sulfatase
MGEVERVYLSALYDGGVIESDRWVKYFLESLGEIGLRDRTLIVVTSDHGEDLGEHYANRAGDHGHALHDDQVMVPLILHNPVERYAVRQVRAQVRTMDIFPTIAEILRVPHESDRGGESFLPLLRDEVSEGRIAYGGMVDAGPRRQFVRYLGHKYIEVVGPAKKGRDLVPPPPEVQLFDLTVDPGEKNNLADESPELVRRFHAMLGSLVNEGQAEPFELPRELDEQTRARLRSLGYLQ